MFFRLSQAAVWLILIIYLCYFKSFKADLPIHALVQDVIGEWSFYLTPLKEGITSLCGSGLPNKNTANLSDELKDYKTYLQKNFGGIEKVIRLKLTGEPFQYIQQSKNSLNRLKWSTLAVYDLSDKNVVGSWTTIYDEGFEIRIGGFRFTAFYKYSEKNLCEPHDNDNLSPSAKSECYSTDSSATHIGWIFTKEGHKEKFKTGCFYGQKDKPYQKNINFITLNTKINDMENEQHGYFLSNEFIDHHNLQSSNWVAKKYDQFKDLGLDDIQHRFKYSSFRKIWRSHDNPSEMVFSKFSLIESSHEESTRNEAHYACECQKDKMTTSRLPSHEAFALKIKQHQPEMILPKEFSWGDPYTSPNWKTDGGIPEVSDQGKCGSCYAFATSYVLQHRFQIAADKMLGKKASILSKGTAFSPQSIISCSFYNQGCYGGYPFFVAKHIYELGIPEENCMPYEENHNSACQIEIKSDKKLIQKFENNKSNSCSESNRWYSNEYGYVGGCYQCNGCDGELLMMEEIYNFGPIVAAVDAPISLLSYSDGIYDSENESHTRICDCYTDCKSNLSGWEYTNHAVAIVGWGEKVNEKGVQKFWIVRNTWGKKWGKNGYFKLIKGKNLGGVENQAVFIDPDFSRGKGLEWIKKNSEKK